MVNVDYCKKVKEMKYCGLPLYSSRCRLTCGICTTKRETVTKPNSIDKGKSSEYDYHLKIMKSQ